jgi:ABC-type phosphate transport system permease subunit
MRAALSRFNSGCFSFFLFAQAKTPTGLSSATQEQGAAGAILSDLAGTWWLWVLLIALVALIGVLFYVRSQKDED